MLKKHIQRITQRAKQLRGDTKVRFILVGITNTAIDFGLFNLLVLFGMDIVPANIIATGVAVAASYLMNKRTVFKDTAQHSASQIALFLLITLTGVWLIQTVVMVHVLGFLQSEFFARTHSLLAWFLQNVAKAVGVAAGALWNYIGYSRLVFKSEKKP